MDETLKTLLEDPNYKLRYVKYKIRVEHRNLPSKLLKNLPKQTAWELKILYEQEKENYIHKKTKRT